MLSYGDANSPAIAAVNGPELTYSDLRGLIGKAHAQLADHGLKRSDVIATSLCNSPETAVILLALLTYCRVAPLNPNYTVHEVNFAIRDVSAALLMTSAGQVNAIAAAEEIGLPVWIGFDPERASSEPRSVEPARPDDVALMLHTSGTTAQPKLVPLTHRNLCLSVCAVANVLELLPADRCLSIMPMFHIHGLVAGLLASIAAGACAVCAPGFHAMSFFTWLDQSKATWYTGVPTMHQAILARARGNSDIISCRRLRVIRSSSAPLHPSVWQQLETVFRTRVVNSYGMTEAAHQIASVRLHNALGRRSGVGTSSGPEMAIIGQHKNILPAGERGEVVLRGSQIMSGYLKPDNANEAGFHDGWFRTGDEGWLDASGVLTLTGRLKEMINSGGEKISPFEVEDALLMHPAVAQAVAFAAPHAMLGEQVMAAVVIRDGQTLIERDLLNTTSSRLAQCKLPKHILFVDEIPRGATGKLQRIGLAERFGI